MRKVAAVAWSLLASCQGPGTLLFLAAIPGGPVPRSAATEQAAAAARAGDCATVKAIGRDMRAHDGGTIRDAAFVNDPVIQHCFLPTEYSHE